jgi:small subunit ribosomal protein S8
VVNSKRKKMDVIGNVVRILTNASRANRLSRCVEWSSLKSGRAKIFKESEYPKDFTREQPSNGHIALKVLLKYVNGVPAITETGRIGKPGRRIYASKEKIPSILGGTGKYVLTTSRGILSGTEARRVAFGGELLRSIL